MIREVIFMGREHVEKKVKAFVPPAITPEFYAGIIFHDPGTKAPEYPQWVQPILRLECNASVLSRRYHFTDIMAEKVVTYLNHIESVSSGFCIFVQSERGVHRAAAVAQFIRAVKKDSIKLTGMVKPLEECKPDLVVLKKLTARWSQTIAEEAARNVK